MKAVHYILIIIAILALILFSSEMIDAPASYALFFLLAFLGAIGNYVMKPLIKGNMWWKLFACGAYGFLLYHLGKVVFLGFVSLLSGLPMNELSSVFNNSPDAQDHWFFLCMLMAVIRLTGYDEMPAKTAIQN